MTSNKPVDKLADNLKGLVIGASGTTPGYQRGTIKRMVEQCGAKFASMNIRECTHLVTTEGNGKRKLKKVNRAREVEGCEIYEKKKAIKLKDKKHEQDASLGDDEGNPSKKTTDEEQINLKRLIDVVDKRYPRSKTEGFSVYQDDAGLIWDATRPLPASVENVLTIIFESKILENYFKFLSSQGRRVLLKKKLDKRILFIDIAVLDKLMKLSDPQLAPGDHSITRKRFCKIYESMMLTDLTFSDTNDTARQELESLDLLLKLHDASEILGKTLPAFFIGHEPDQSLKLTLLDTEGKLDRVQDAPGEIIGIFRLERPGESKRFAQWKRANLAHIGDRRLLWHGSTSSNFAGILSRGLRGDGIVGTNGKHFVPGVFFADMSTKSAGY
ncbi:hypothetical protein PDIDSM_3000 [Penicillium digitatum]|nr:hypothetical protein PDIDSM_3000 [Penicillium digitatum]